MDDDEVARALERSKGRHPSHQARQCRERVNEAGLDILTCDREDGHEGAHVARALGVLWSRIHES